MPSSRQASIESSIDVIPITEAHIDGFRTCLDSVARERLYLSLLEAPPLSSVAEFVRSHIESGHPQVVAVTPEGRVVGWCDITPLKREGFTHGGRLGMGVHREYRERGLGRRLMEAALRMARECGLERVELEVYSSNARAIALYEKCGFGREGVRKRARKLDGRYDDLVFMAVLF